jgi:hypothetical protein
LLSHRGGTQQNTRSRQDELVGVGHRDGADGDAVDGGGLARA